MRAVTPSAPPRIGLLWDSLSPNIGDQTIGVAVARLVRQAGFDHLRPVAVGSSNVKAFDTLVIGGGELLRPDRHGYYDVFRVPGRHVLNTVGTDGELDAAYLDSYRLVSVRSEADRRNLANLHRDVRVAPCLTVLFDRVVEHSDPLELPKDGIGIHLHSSSFEAGDGEVVLDILRRFGDRVVMFPFTHYNQDRALQTVVAEHLGMREPVPLTTPDQAFDSIRRLGAVVTTSLHATIMAYSTGTPFVAVGYASKVRHFLNERNLGNRLIDSFVDVERKLDLLQPESADWSAQLDADRRSADDLLQAILVELDDAATRRPDRTGPMADWNEPGHARQNHEAMMSAHEQYGLRIAERLSAEYERDRYRRYAEKLECQLQDVTEELERAGRYARNLKRQLTTRETNGETP